MLTCLLSSCLSGVNCFPVDLHDVPGVPFECSIAPFRAYLWPHKRFSLQATAVQLYILLRQENESGKHTARREGREGEGGKRCIYRALRVSLDKQRACVLPWGYKGLWVVSCETGEDGEDGDSEVVARPWCNPLMSPPTPTPLHPASGQCSLDLDHLGWHRPCVCVCVCLCWEQHGA